MAYFRIGTGVGSITMHQVYSTYGATFSIPAGTLNGQDAFICTGLNAGRSQLNFTSNNGALALKGFSMMNYTGSSAVHSYLYKLSGYDKSSVITISTGLGSDSNAYTTHTILQSVTSQGTEIVMGTAATSTNGTVSISAEIGQYFMCCGYEASGGLVISGATSLGGIGTNNNAGARILQATATTVTVRTQASSYKTVSIVPIT